MLDITYRVKIPNPADHQVGVVVELMGDLPDSLSFLLPSWSPGSYLIREYARHVNRVEASNEAGERLNCYKTDKGVWKVEGSKGKKLSFSYWVYAHELTVRTSHVTSEHAFLHGPSYLVSTVGHEKTPHKLKLEIPKGWTKVTTALKEISEKRDEFIFEAPNYDHLIDCPIELGNQLTDGFMVDGIPHELAFFGTFLPMPERSFEKIKEDIKTIVIFVSKMMGGLPYNDKYTFITHLIPQKFGGLEHANSTALHYCPWQLATDKGYRRWLELVAHEYFHTWNVKRIRPLELGPFDYRNEAFTRMHWLTEGLTSFMDQLIVYRAGLMTLEEYLGEMGENYKRYLNIPGRKFDSVEESSFDAWIKLYRPDENSLNSSVSYYLKGGLVFFILHAMLTRQKSSIDELLKLLWHRYLENPAIGVTSDEVLAMIQEIGGMEVRDKFEEMVQTTIDLPWESALETLGLRSEYDESFECDFGLRVKTEGERVFAEVVIQGLSASKCGVHAGDELIALNGLRLTSSIWKELEKTLSINQNYELMVSREEHLMSLNLLLARKGRFFRKICLENRDKAEAALLGALK